MLVSKLLASSGGGGVNKLYSDDVFQSYTRTGTGADVTVTTNIDMTKGYMLWSKGRSGATDHAIYDSARGVTLDLVSNSTAAQTTQATGLKSVSATGHTVGSLAKMNTSAATYVDFVFRKAPKFFDVVTYTGNGANRTISHSLGQVPGMIIVKRTDTAGSWMVYHNALANTENLVLNTTASKATNATAWNSTTATSSIFSLGTHADVNTNTGTFVAYLFAHDTGTDGLIQCGSFTADAGGLASVTLGWEPQYVLTKAIASAESWQIGDVSRGMTQTDLAKLLANGSGAEGNVGISYLPIPTATGFSAAGFSASTTFIYLAIRRPNKPPTTGTQVFEAATFTGNGATQTVGTLPGTDLAIFAYRTSTFSPRSSFFDRLRGDGSRLRPSDTSADIAQPLWMQFTKNATGVTVGPDSEENLNTYPRIGWLFKRAPGVFDVVCRNGGNSANTRYLHSLGVAPELILLKSRSLTGAWYVYSASTTRNAFLLLASTSAAISSSNFWGASNPSITDFGVDDTGSGAALLTTTSAVAYLFATLAGISKVGSYTGNGGTQTIDCGFTTGARFILIKRTDSTGDWFLWDTARGIVAGNDPHLSLNATTAEVTTDDSIDPDTSGFIVNELAATHINVTSATYIFLALA